MTLYLSDVEEHEDLLFEVCAPLSSAEEAQVGAVLDHEPWLRLHRLPAATLAVLVHDGRYDTIWNAYAELHAWIWQQGMEIDGPIRECGLVTSLDTPDAHAWRTEVALPVRPRTAT